MKGDRLITPSSLRREMLDKIHSSHLGVEKCINRARETVYWPGVCEQIKEKVAKCEICNKYRNCQMKEPLLPHPVPDRPWQVLAADLLVLPQGKFVVLVDYYSKYFELTQLYGGAFWTKMQSNRDLHSIGSYFHSIGSYFHSIRSYFHSIRSYFHSIRSYFHSIGSYFHSIGSYFHSIRSYFNYFVANYMTLVYSSVMFHIYPYLRGNSIPSDLNYRSAVVTIWSAVKRGRLNLDLVSVWRHTTYDYMTYN